VVLHLPALSLSVEPEDPALRVYQRAGFVPVGGDICCLKL
jgi:hypothetical protein